MPKVVGYLNKCPICGEDGQELRENKRGTLYMYCERGCSFKFSGAKSRKIKASLAAGKSIVDPNFTIFLQNPVQNDVKHIEQQGVNTNGKPGEYRGIEPVGRTNGQPAAVTGVQAAGNKPRNWLADWLGDDDE